MSSAIFAGAALISLLGACAGSTESRTAPATVSTTKGPPTTAVAGAAEQMIREDSELKGQLAPGEPFLAFECNPQLLEDRPEGCWQPWLNGFSFSNGALQVRLQVDRTDPFSQLQAEQAAIWFRNYISADKGLLRDNVEIIVVTDGTGTTMARQAALRR